LPGEHARCPALNFAATRDSMAARTSRFRANLSIVRRPSMKLRPLGRSGLQVAPLAFGGNVFGWSADEAASFSLLDAFVDAGFDLIDTADMYSRWVPGHSGGESETMIGKWLRKSGKRHSVTIATKVGKDMGHGNTGLSRQHIARSIDASLKRLQTDHVDLYQSHADDADVAFEETLEAYAKLIEAGKVRAIGASNYTADRFAAALDVSERDGLPRYESLQPHYNLVERALFENDLEPLCVKRGVGVINYYGLASGFLSGKYRSAADLGKSPARGGSAKKYLDAKGLRVLAALDDVGLRYDVPPATVAIAWLVARPSITAPIASATSVAQLKALLAGATLALDAAAIAQLDAASVPEA
jgi:aryl-alcohol dehydrogenase-like predicted oxidoreductase